MPSPRPALSLPPQPILAARILRLVPRWAGKPTHHLTLHYDHPWRTMVSTTWWTAQLRLPGLGLTIPSDGDNGRQAGKQWRGEWPRAPGYAIPVGRGRAINWPHAQPEPPGRREICGHHPGNSGSAPNILRHMGYPGQVAVASKDTNGVSAAVSPATAGTRVTSLADVNWSTWTVSRSRRRYSRRI
jgi:hypothetical protein